MTVDGAEQTGKPDGDVEWGPDAPAVYGVLNGVHVGTAWFFAALIFGHMAYALKHAWVDRDHVFARMSFKRST